MNLFDPHDGDDADDAVGPGSHPSGRWIEALLRGRGLPVPDDGFRSSVVVAMEEAALERRLMLAGEARFAPAANPWQRLLPEMLAGIALALVVSIASRRPPGTRPPRCPPRSVCSVVGHRPAARRVLGFRPRPPALVRCAEPLACAVLSRSRALC